MPNNKSTTDPSEPPPPPPPPRAPPDLLTMVKLVFYIRVNAVLHQRKEAADREVDEYWRMRDEKDAKKAVKPVRQRAREIQEKREARRRPAPYIYRRPEVDPREKLTWRDIDHLMDEEVEKEVNVGLGLKRAEGETLKAYNQRMDHLEHRLDQWITIEYYRQQNGPLRYMEGMPVSLIAVHRNIRPIKPPKPTRRKPCLQCKARGLPCSRTLDFRYGPAVGRNPKKEDCSRCKRNGDRCLIMWDWQTDDGEDHKIWKYTGGPRDDQAECVRKWMDKIKESRRIKPLPAWHENDHSEEKRDHEYQPKGWWHVLKDGLTEW